jgi:hypothetical protein
MSIIENAERYMKRYDYLMEKRERKHKQGKRLTSEEDEELQKLRPNVVTPIFVMFELLHDIVKTNQEVRKSKNYRQFGGGPKSEQDATKTATTAAAAAAAAAAASAAAAAAATGTAIPQLEPSAPPLEENDAADDAADDATDEDADAKEAGRLMALEESLLPLLTKIIVFIEQNKKAEKKKDDEDEEEKYPDIGTTAKNSAILVIRRIKKWWNDLIQGGSSDLSSKINLKKAIPQLADNSADMNKLNAMADKVITAVDSPLQRIAKVLSNDVRDIASSSVEGIMNALSLIPGIGTTLQLWRLLQNVIVIMSKSVTTMAGAKTEGVALKTNVLGLKDQLAGDAMNMAQGAGAGAVAGAVGSAMGSTGVPDLASIASDPKKALGSMMPPGAPDLTSMIPGGAGSALGAASSMIPGGAGSALGAASSMIPGGAGSALGAASSMIPGGAGSALGAASSMIPGGAGSAVGLAGKFLKGGTATATKLPTNHLRSIKKYKREYKQSLREIRKTRKKMMKYIRNII